MAADNCYRPRACHGSGSGRFPRRCLIGGYSPPLCRTKRTPLATGPRAVVFLHTPFATRLERSRLVLLGSRHRTLDCLQGIASRSAHLTLLVHRQVHVARGRSSVPSQWTDYCQQESVDQSGPSKELSIAQGDWNKSVTTARSLVGRSQEPMGPRSFKTTTCLDHHHRLSALSI